MLIYDDRSVDCNHNPFKTSNSLLLVSFLKEKQRPNHIIRDMVDFYKVPVYELNRIKNGADFVTPEGECNTQFTFNPPFGSRLRK